jgi:hypothetical protein
MYYRDSGYFDEMVICEGIDDYGALSMPKKITENKPNKVRQISVGVYLDEDTKRRFNKAIRKEQDKEIEKDGVSTISKSNFLESYILKWLDKNYPE